MFPTRVQFSVTCSGLGLHIYEQYLVDTKKSNVLNTVNYRTVQCRDESDEKKSYLRHLQQIKFGKFFLPFNSELCSRLFM